MIPFGKYRGDPLSALDYDPEYVSWLLGQDWLQEMYPDVHAYVITLGVAPKMKCSGQTKEGNPCSYWARHEGYCNRHLAKAYSEDFSEWEAEFASGEFQEA